MSAIKSEAVREELGREWIYHTNRCDFCAGFPKLCPRGEKLSRQLWPEDWTEEMNKAVRQYQIDMELA